MIVVMAAAAAALASCGGVQQPPSQTLAKTATTPTATTPTTPTTPTATTPTTATTATTPEPPASSGNPDVPAATGTTTTPAQPSAAARHFEGKGTTKLGDLSVPRDAVLNWTSEGRTFAVTDAGFKIKLQSTDHSGAVDVKAGDYKDVEVDASGAWTIEINAR
jgi:hypothetical protein